MDEIEFGGNKRWPRRRVAIGLGVVLMVAFGLVIWQRQTAALPRASTPVVRQSPLPPNVVLCCDEVNDVKDDKTFHQGFEIRNFSNTAATITDIVVETPVSFHQVAVGLIVTSDANEVGQSNITLLSTYTMPPHSTAYVVVEGSVKCPAADVDATPRVSLKVDGTAMSFETPMASRGSWEADVASFACGK